jgi:hypothetical protein
MGNRRATPTPGAPRFPRDAWALGALERARVEEGAALGALRGGDDECFATAAIRQGAPPEGVAAALAKAAHVGVAEAEDSVTKPIQPASLVARTRAVLRRVGNT